MIINPPGINVRIGRSVQANKSILFLSYNYSTIGSFRAVYLLSPLIHNILYEQDIQ